MRHRLAYVVAMCVAIVNPQTAIAATPIFSIKQPVRLHAILSAYDSRSIQISLPSKGVPAVRYAALAPVFRYNYSVSGETDRLPAISGGVAYVASGTGIHSFDLSTRTDRRLAAYAPITPVFLTAHTLLFGTGDRTEGDPRKLRVLAIDSRTGSMRWKTRGQMLGAGSGTALINVASDDPNDVFSKHLVGIDVAKGKRRWVNRNGGCRPRPPLVFLDTRVLLPWEGSCEVSAVQPFLVWMQLDDGAMNDTGDATSVLTQRANELYLTGEDQHWGSYGPANLAVYNAATAKINRSRTIAPDRPLVDMVAFNTVATGYALGDALWVQLAYDAPNTFDLYAAAVYRYDIHDMHARPGRVAPNFGSWLGAAYENETFFSRGNTVAALIATSNHSARAADFTGAISKPVQALAFDGNLYVREAGGNVAIYDIGSRQEVEYVAAGCAKLKEVVVTDHRRYLVCSNIDPTNQKGINESDAFVELP